MQLSEYPVEIQELLKEAGHHLESLEILEHDFVAWWKASGLFLKGPSFTGMAWTAVLEGVDHE